MLPISSKTSIVHSLFVNFLSAFNHLSRVPDLSNILVTINAIAPQIWRIKNPVEHLR